MLVCVFLCVCVRVRVLTIVQCQEINLGTDFENQFGNRLN